MFRSLLFLVLSSTTFWSSSTIFPFRVQAAGWISQNSALLALTFRRSEEARSQFSRQRLLIQRRRRRQATTSTTNKDDSGDDVRPRLSPKNKSKKKDLLVISWECLVDTLEWRIETGLKAAYEVWPELEIMTMESADLQWLCNKLGALQHVLTPPPPTPPSASELHGKKYNYSPAVEYGLAIRMLLEEQELDEGRSNGSKGKYGSRFHPSAHDKAFASTTTTTSRSSSNSNTAPTTHTAATRRSDNFNAQRRGRRQQRPLTVGEIAANWQETLREAVMIRYYQEDQENPLEQLHDAIVQIQLEKIAENEKEDVKLELSTDMAAMLQDRFAFLTSTSSSSCGVIVTVHHEMDLPAARRSIENALLSLSSSLPSFSSSSLSMIRICESRSELSACDILQNETILILCSHTNETSSACSTMTSIMAACPEDSTIHVVESYWPLLEAYIPLFGERVPCRPGTIGECMLLDEYCENANDDHDDTGRRFLQLCLAQWASHPDSQSAAMMNPWTTVMSLTDCQELVTARISAQQEQQQGFKK